MTSEGLGEMFEGDSADTCARKFPLMLMGGRANGPALISACQDLFCLGLLVVFFGFVDLGLWVVVFFGFVDLGLLVVVSASVELTS